MRLRHQIGQTLTTSQSDTSAVPQMWSCVEASFGVVAACIPSLAPLILLMFGKLPNANRAYTPCYDHTKNPVSRPVSRSPRNPKRKFNRIADLVESNPRSQSLELIMQQPQGSSAENGKMADQRTLEHEKAVIKQINQNSWERLENRAGDSLGVDSSAGT